MKFALTREALLGPLQRVAGTCEKRPALPILSHVLVKLTGTRLELTGTDLEQQLITCAEAETGEDGAITLPARKLLDIARLLPDGAMLNLVIGDDGKATLKSGRSRFSLGTLPAENFPAFELKPPKAELTLSGLALKRAISRTLSAMAVEDVRYYLNGMLLATDGLIFRAIASDGHRLAIHEETLTDAAPEPRQAIIPRKAVLELHKLLGDKDEPVTLKFASNSLTVLAGNVQFATKLIEGRFPDFQRVMPKAITKTATVGREALRQAITRLTVLMTEKVKAISLDFQSDTLTMNASNPEHEDAEDALDVKLDGTPVLIGFNAVYVLDMLNHIDNDEVRLSFTDEANVCLAEDPNNAAYRFILMPMRL